MQDSNCHCNFTGLHPVYDINILKMSSIESGARLIFIYSDTKLKALCLVFVGYLVIDIHSMYRLHPLSPVKSIKYLTCRLYTAVSSITYFSGLVKDNNTCWSPPSTHLLSIQLSKQSITHRSSNVISFYHEVTYLQRYRYTLLGAGQG